MDNLQQAHTSSARSHYFSDEYYYEGNNDLDTSLRLIRYNKETWENVPLKTDGNSLRKYIKDDCINWFNIRGFRNGKLIASVVKEFGLHPLNVKDILNPAEVVKVENQKDYFFITLNNCSFNAKNHISTEHICLFVCRNIIISFCETEATVFLLVEKAIKQNILNIRQGGEGVLLAFLLNAVVADLIKTADRVEQMLEKLEDVLLENHYNQGNVGIKIQQCLHAHLLIRKNVQPLKDEFPKLLIHRDDMLITPQAVPLLSDVSDQVKYILQATDNSKDMIASLVDLYVSNNDLRTNAIMKRLTIVSTLFIPITFLVGVWGMNFHFMPELDWKFGYFFAWITILLTVLITWLLMKKKKWF